MAVDIWEEEVIIPTYEVGKPDKNPMFLEKTRVSGQFGQGVSLSGDRDDKSQADRQGISRRIHRK